MYISIFFYINAIILHKYFIIVCKRMILFGFIQNCAFPSVVWGWGVGCCLGVFFARGMSRIMNSTFEINLDGETLENAMLHKIYFDQFRDKIQSFQVHKRILILLKLQILTYLLTMMLLMIFS